MKKIIFTCATILFFLTYTFAQKDTLSSEQTKQLLSKLPFDSVTFLRNFSNNACACIDSLSSQYKSREDVTKEVAACIDKQVGAYELAIKLASSLKNGNKQNNIYLSFDKNSNQYKKYYYDIEERLIDSCTSLRKLLRSNDKMSEKSTSNDRLAIKNYDQGVTLLQQEKYTEALVYFRKAVELDAEFAFAWDNIGICERKLNNFDAAIAAYNKSLSIDPKGAMPLHNLCYAYEFKKDYDSALLSINRLLAVYPNDPEGFYSAGRIFTYFKKDFAKGLDQMCKAYNLYDEQKSPYRSDAQQNIQYIYSEMKKLGEIEKFKEILKANKINMTE